MPANPAGAPQPARAARRFNRRAIATLVGRMQGPELFVAQSFTALNNPILPRTLNINRPLESIRLMFRGRVVIATANVATPGAESPMNLIQRVRITGTHARFNQLIPIDLTGGTAFVWPRLFNVRGSSLLIGSTRIADPGVPFTMPAATFGNIGTYDIEFHVFIPVGPMFGPHSRGLGVPYYWYPQDWADTISLQLFFGDATSFGGVIGNTTFSSFGSGAGSPTVSVFLNYAILGALADNVQTACVIRNEQTIVGGVVAAVANSQQLQILQKQKTLNYLAKTGILLTGQSAGVQTFASLNDTMLDRTQILIDNKPVRNNQSNPAAKEYGGQQYNTIWPAGYLLHTFIDSQNPLTAYPGDTISGGSNFIALTDVLTATANQAATLVQEQMFGDPRVLG